MKPFIKAMIVGLLILVLSGCSSETTSTESSSTIGSGNTAATDALVVTAKNFQFDQAEFHVKANKALKVTLKVPEGMHGLSIPDLNVSMMSAGVMTVDASKPGTYDMMCSVPCGEGHLIMKSKLVVE